MKNISPLFLKLLIYSILFTSLRMIIGGYSSLYLLSHGLHYADIAYLKSFQSLIIILSQIPVGYFIDKAQNRFRFIMLSMFLAAAWLFLTGIATDKAVFFIAEILNAISLSIFNAVMLPILVETYTFETNTRNYNETLGIFFKIQNIVMALFVILGSLFVDVSSRSPWLLSALFLILAIFYAIASEDIKKFKFSKVNKKTKLKKHYGLVFSYLFENKITSLFAANVALTTIFMILAQFWQIFISEYLHLTFSYALVYGGCFSVILILQAIGSSIAEKHDSINSSLLSTVGLTLCSGLLIVLNKNHSMIGITTFLFLFILFKYPSVIISAEIHQGLPDEIRASFDSLSSLLTMILSIVFFCLLGEYLKKFGTNVLAYSLLGCSLIAFFGICTHIINIRNNTALSAG